MCDRLCAYKHVNSRVRDLGHFTISIIIVIVNPVITVITVIIAGPAAGIVVRTTPVDECSRK